MATPPCHWVSPPSIDEGIWSEEEMAPLSSARAMRLRIEDLKPLSDACCREMPSVMVREAAGMIADAMVAVTFAANTFVAEAKQAINSRCRNFILHRRKC